MRIRKTRKNSLRGVESCLQITKMRILKTVKEKHRGQTEQRLENGKLSAPLFRKDQINKNNTDSCIAKP